MKRIPSIIFEDNHLLVVNKPAGMPSQGDETGDESIVDWGKGYIKEKYNKPGNVYLGLVHRLDRPTGGILILCKTSKAAGRLSDQFQHKKVQKTYYAITEQIPSQPKGVLKHHLKKLPGKNIVRAYKKPMSDTKPAELSYKILAKKGKRALVEVFPKTGRRHQIRVQLASMGCNIQGDVKYGQSTFNFDKSIALFAKKISFIHPTLKEMVTFEADLPKNEIWDGWY